MFRQLEYEAKSDDVWWFGETYQEKENCKLKLFKETEHQISF